MKITREFIAKFIGIDCPTPEQVCDISKCTKSQVKNLHLLMDVEALIQRAERETVKGVVEQIYSCIQIRNSEGEFCFNINVVKLKETLDSLEQGGKDDACPLSETHDYDPETRTYTKKTKLPKQLAIETFSPENLPWNTAKTLNELINYLKEKEIKND